MRLAVLAIAAAPLLAACAADPSSIQPIAMSSSAYAGASCSAAAQERQGLAVRLASLEQDQRRAAREDTVNVLLWGVPTASLRGKDRTAEIASVRGQIDALDARLAACS